MNAINFQTIKWIFVQAITNNGGVSADWVLVGLAALFFMVVGSMFTEIKKKPKRSCNNGPHS